MPNSLIEAMASGLACVATDIGGIRDVISDHTSGVLVPPDNAGALAAALQALIAAPESIPLLGKNARTFAEQSLDLEKIANRYVETYRGIIARNP
jgi:glycosyltransferase involved in cell wall biosynthesis